jgi:CheY-like chemotaxis protein
VLVLDDEEMVRSMIHAYLRRSGYCVLEAATGAEAARIAEHHGAPIDLLLTDV